MIRFPALFAAYLAIEREPRSAPADLDPEERLRRLLEGPPVPEPRFDRPDLDDLPPMWTPPAPPNRAQRRAAEREDRRRKKRTRLGLWWGIDHAKRDR